MKFYLIPRLNYFYSLRDFGISLMGTFRSVKDTSQISKIFNTDNIYFSNSARTGLRLLLNSLNLPPNARIGIQIYNCNTVFGAISKSGYKPVFIDIDENLTISPDDLNKKKDQIDALIVTHIFGIPADVDQFKRIIGNKPIIEDCAHSFLSVGNGNLTGTIGDAAIFSFGKAKFPSIGNGGFVIINNRNIIPRFNANFKELKENNIFDEIKNLLISLFQRLLHDKYIYRVITFPFVKKLNNSLELDKNYFYEEKKAYKSSLSLFLHKSSEYELIKEKQIKNAILLKRYLNKFENLKFIRINDKSEPNYFMLPVITNKKQHLIESFNKMGIEIGSHFEKSIEWAKEYGYQTNDCRNAESIIHNLVILPTYMSLKLD